MKIHFVQDGQRYFFNDFACGGDYTFRWKEKRHDLGNGMGIQGTTRHWLLITLKGNWVYYNGFEWRIVTDEEAIALINGRFARYNPKAYKKSKFAPKEMKEIEV